MTTLSAPKRLSRRAIIVGMGSGLAVLVAACSAPAAAPTAAPAAPAAPTATTAAAAPAAAAPTATTAAAAPAAAAPTATTAAAAPAAAPTATAKPAEAAQPAAQGPTLAKLDGKNGVLWGLKYDPHVATYHRLADQFQKLTGATLKIEPQDWPIETKLIASLAAGVQPDAACIMGRVLLPLWLRKNILIDCGPLYKEMNVNTAKDFYAMPIQAYTWEGKVWGVPVEPGFGVGAQVSVPVDEAQKAGIASTTPPLNGQDFFASYQQLWDDAKALMTKDSSGKVKRYGLSSQGWDMASYLGIILSQGVKWWDDDNKKFNFNSDAGIKAFQLLVETPVKLGIETQLNMTQADAALAGKVAIARSNGPGSTTETSKLGYHFDNAIAPPVVGALSDKDPLFAGEGGWGFAGLEKAKNKDIAVEFLKFMMTKDGQWSYSQIYGGIAGAMRSVNDDPKKWPADKKNEWAGPYRLLQAGDRFQYYGIGYGYQTDMDKYVSQVAADIRSGKINSEQGAKNLQALAEKGYLQYVADAKALSQ